MLRAALNDGEEMIRLEAGNAADRIGPRAKALETDLVQAERSEGQDELSVAGGQPGGMCCAVRPTRCDSG